MSSKYKNLNKELQQLIDDYGNNKNPERSKEMINMILNVYQKTYKIGIWVKVIIMKIIMIIWN